MIFSLLQVSILVHAITAAPFFGQELRSSAISDLPTFQPSSVQLDPAVDMPSHMARQTQKSIVADAKAVLAKTLGLRDNELIISKAFTDNAGILHVFTDRVIHGITGSLNLIKSSTKAVKLELKMAKLSQSSLQ